MGAKENKARGKRKDRVYIPFEKEKKGPSWILIAILFVSIWPVGALVLIKKLRVMWNNKKMSDYRSYAAIIADRSEVDIRELSAKLGKTRSLVASDLQAMIEKGYLGPNAYIDRSRAKLILDALEAEFVDDVIYADAEEPEEEPVKSRVSESIKNEFKRAFDAESAFTAEAPAPEEVPDEPQEQPSEADDAFSDMLRQIRQLNNEIEDEGVSHRIDRIGELTASISAVVREKPDRADEVKKFMNYYLPTTLKLLKSYSLMEKQSYQGENIVASRQKIENILDSLITAFEQQQDRLFRTEAMDVEADIQVLETMMAKDGLITPKGLDLRAMGRK